MLVTIADDVWLFHIFFHAAVNSVAVTSKNNDNGGVFVHRVLLPLERLWKLAEDWWKTLHELAGKHC